jgi:hypothetical protein
MNSATKEYSIFLSYAHQDAPWVAEFANALHAAGIHDYWFDGEILRAGDSFAEKIEDALRQSDTLVVFFSPNSLTNSNVFFELGAAFAGDKEIIPVLIGNVDPKQVPLSLASRQWLRAETPSEAAKQVARIIQKSS